MTETIKAITLWQPWATLIALGLKKYETRSWLTYYRGPLVIHAANRKMTPAERSLLERIKSIPTVSDLPNPEDFPLGAIVATAKLVDCIPAGEFIPDLLEKQVGNFAHGRFAWKLEDIKPLDIRNVKGHQGFWTIKNPKHFGISA